MRTFRLPTLVLGLLFASLGTLWAQNPPVWVTNHSSPTRDYFDIVAGFNALEYKLYDDPLGVTSQQNLLRTVNSTQIPLTGLNSVTFIPGSDQEILVQARPDSSPNTSYLLRWSTNLATWQIYKPDSLYFQDDLNTFEQTQIEFAQQSYLVSKLGKLYFFDQATGLLNTYSVPGRSLNSNDFDRTGFFASTFDPQTFTRNYYVNNGSQLRQITLGTNANTDWFVRDGNWLYYRGTDFSTGPGVPEVRRLNLTTGQEQVISINGELPDSPPTFIAKFGKAVWTTDVVSGSPAIYYFDGTSTTQVEASFEGFMDLDFNGENLVYNREVNGNYSTFVYDRAGKRNLNVETVELSFEPTSASARLWVTGFPNGGNFLQIGYISFPTITANEAEQTVSLSLYPNPTTDFATLHAPQAAGQPYRVLDNMGRLMMAGTLQIEQNKLDLSSLLPGLYFVQVGSYQTQTLKLLKQ